MPHAGATLSPAFSPYINSLFFLHGAYVFEPVGATAYLGAAPLLANNATLLSAAAGIYGVEVSLPVCMLRLPAVAHACTQSCWLPQLELCSEPCILLTLMRLPVVAMLRADTPLQASC